MYKFLFFLLIISSCSEKKINKEVEVIDDVFLELVGTDYYIKPKPLQPYNPIHPDTLRKHIDIDAENDTMIISLGENEGLDTVIYDTIISNQSELIEEAIEEYNSFDWKKYYRDHKEWKRLSDTIIYDERDLIIVIEDSLIGFPFRAYEHEPRLWGDSIINKLVIKLYDSSLVSHHFNVFNIDKTGKYKLKNANGIEERIESNDSSRLIGLYRFSRVVFNENGQGCFYSYFICGDVCGGEKLVFVEKKNGKWNISNTWVISQF